MNIYQKNYLLFEYKLNYDIYSRQTETDEVAPKIPQALKTDTINSISTTSEEDLKCEH